MKKALRFSALMAAFVSASSFLQAQPMEGVIKYAKIYNLDTVHNFSADSTGIPSFLYFHTFRSLYVYNRSGDMEIKETNEEKLKKAEESGMAVIHENEDIDAHGNMYYKDFKTKTLIVRELVNAQGFITEEPLPPFQWNIWKETRKIGDFSCQKATTRFRGRDYIAWFTSEIPIRTGPWKFYGLPGLILEVYDTQRRVQFLFQSATIPYSTDKDLVEPMNGKKISYPEFRNIKKTEIEKIINSLTSGERNNSVKIEAQYFSIETAYE